jgi:HAD superfamily hydrolase (TIGR01490 family)
VGTARQDPAPSPAPRACGHRPTSATTSPVFDLDRTLIDGSSLVTLGRELVRRRIVPAGVMARRAVAQLTFRFRGLSDARLERLVSTMLEAVEGMEAEPVEEAARAAGVTVASSVHPAARRLIDHHLAAGHFCVIVSVSPHPLVESVTAALRMHRAVGSRLEVLDSRCTGRFEGAFCHGFGKLVRLEGELGRFDLGSATAYADSGSDVPLLQRCGAAVAINPDARLRRVARKQSWPILRLR